MKGAGSWNAWPCMTMVAAQRYSLTTAFVASGNFSATVAHREAVESEGPRTYALLVVAIML